MVSHRRHPIEKEDSHYGLGETVSSQVLGDAPGPRELEIRESRQCGIGANFASAFLSPPGLLTKAAKADCGEIENMLMG